MHRLVIACPDRYLDLAGRLDHDDKHPSTTTSPSTTTATSDLATRFPKTKAGAEGFVKYLCSP